MNRKYIGIFIIILAILLLIAIVYFVFFYNFPETTNTPIEQEQEVVTNQANLQPLPGETKVIEEKKQNISQRKEISSADLERIAASFAERFGSYSNHSNFQNIKDLELFMTNDMKLWSKNFIKANSTEYSKIYYGISTTAVTRETISFDADLGKAEIKVQTQRRESTGTMDNTSTFYQDIIIKFVKENNIWKVDAATWQEK